jgi:hypothetical protein
VSVIIWPGYGQSSWWTIQQIRFFQNYRLCKAHISEMKQWNEIFFLLIDSSWSLLQNIFLMLWILCFLNFLQSVYKWSLQRPQGGGDKGPHIHLPNHNSNNDKSKTRYFNTIGFRRIRQVPTVRYQRISSTESDRIQQLELVGNQRISMVFSSRIRYKIRLPDIFG